MGQTQFLKINTRNAIFYCFPVNYVLIIMNGMRKGWMFYLPFFSNLPLYLQENLKKTHGKMYFFTSVRMSPSSATIHRRFSVYIIWLHRLWKFCFLYKNKTCSYHCKLHYPACKIMDFINIIYLCTQLKRKTFTKLLSYNG